MTAKKLRNFYKEYIMMTNKNQKTVVMFGSDFSVYGKLQATKSTLQYLATSLGMRFIFVNDVARGDNYKIKVGNKTLVGNTFSPSELNKLLGA
ncbi:hypothetical protein NVP1262O_58 [Vibrio phage 1.262.O._10N.286.51.A9]|nr:hypothetical protein NVP1262O_58 [Vibrio phage 1.262.O._10N.286.51.A9]